MSSQTRLPSGIYSAFDYYQLAQEALPEANFAYLSGGSGQELSLNKNAQFWDKISFIPRLLNHVREGHTQFDLAGQSLQHPFFLAPVAHQKLFHGGGELETARGAAATDTPMILSTLSSHRVEDIVAQSPPNRYWFQLYFQPSHNDTLELVNRAEQAGCSAIVVTLDTAIQAPSFRALRAGFPFSKLPVPPNLAAHTESQTLLERSTGGNVFQRYMQFAPVWEDLYDLIENSNVPVWVKGVMHPQDAIQLKQAGCAGVIISNHGGRGLDSSAATGSLIKPMRDAVGADFPVLVDGGIRSGSDAFKAIALGADGVLIGKLQACALSVAGALGVGHLMKLFREEFEMTMALCGCSRISDISDSLLNNNE